MRHRGDTTYGPTQIGGLVHATAQCPIFDTRSGSGNFLVEEASGLDLGAALLPPSDFNPFKDSGFVYVVNVLALPYYEVSVQYTSTESGYIGGNWVNLLKVGSRILGAASSIGSFVERITTRVRLSQTGGWDLKLASRGYIMQVTTPSFGQVVRDESIAYPIMPHTHNNLALDSLRKIRRDADSKRRAVQKRLEDTSGKR